MKQTYFECNSIYHVYNHANGGENLFITQENFQYFLRKYLEKLGQIADTIAYCFMPNHFHLLIRIREESVLDDFINRRNTITGKSIIPENIPKEERYHFLVKRQFQNLFNGYVKAFNKYHNRKGSLLQQNTRRKLIHNDQYLLNSIIYIHLNPVFHKFTNFPEDWPNSSYCTYLNEKDTFLVKNEIIHWFGGKKIFRKAHEESIAKEQIIDADFEYNVTLKNIPGSFTIEKER